MMEALSLLRLNLKNLHELRTPETFFLRVLIIMALIVEETAPKPEIDRETIPENPGLGFCFRLWSWGFRGLGLQV